MNYRLTAQLLSRLYGVVAVAMLAAVPWGWNSPDHGGAEALGIGAAVVAFIALMLRFFGRHADPVLRIKEALLVVTVGWFSVTVLGAVPFVVSGAIPSWFDAFFETASGLTTTGSTILVDIEALPDGILFWRLMTHWLGGLGIVVLFVALFPQLGVGAKHLFKSEMPGPITEGLRPKIKETAVTLWWIYAGLTGTLAVLLWLGGLSPFEALANGMSTIATGGFSTRNSSIGSFDSPYVEWVICLFMYLAGINFTLHYAVLSGRGRQLIRDGEWRYYSTVILVISLLVATMILPLHEGDLETAYRKSLFQVLATATTTGFATDNYEAWPIFCQVLIVMLMVVGGCAGSTAGGMKMSRAVILVKSAFVEVAHTARPHTIKAVKIGRAAIGADVLKQVYAYAVVFALTVFVCALSLSVFGVDLLTSFTAALTCVANGGPAFGDVGPTENFAWVPGPAKVVLAFGMILGRLEFFTVLAVFLPSLWRH